MAEIKKVTKISFETLHPADIEKRSFELISKELSHDKVSLQELNGQELDVLKRVIHTTADFDYTKNLLFREGALARGLEALKGGACIVTDTQMAKAGINKKALARFGGEVLCFMADEDVAVQAKEQGTTRASVSMEKAANLCRPMIVAVGNAPTALIRLCELMKAGKVKPELVIGVPVGFVNVTEAKELLWESGAPAIVAVGRKGGSNVAAAICNAMLYQLGGRS